MISSKEHVFYSKNFSIVYNYILFLVSGFLLSFLNPVHPRHHYDDAFHWKLHGTTSNSESTTHGKNVVEVSTNGNDNVAFDMSMLEKETTRDNGGDLPV